MAAGADRFIPKPADRERLLSTMVELELSQSVADPQEELAETEAPPAAPSPAVPQPRDDDAGREAEQILVVDPEWAEAFPGFLRNYRDAVEGMARALAEEDREDLQFLAHRLSGGLSAMGLHWAARQARTIEHDARAAGRASLDARIAALREHLARVRIEAA
jgi:HPt (histidine-containing phosphotransfer) domain-containing protein